MRDREERGEARARAAVVLYRVDAPPSAWDRVVSELHEGGTIGIEERPGDSPPRLLAYFGQGHRPDWIATVAGLDSGVRVHPPSTVPDQDWTTRWREGLAPRRVGPLWIRPSWCPSQGTPEIEIDPERAFGSGEHASTRLSLHLLLDELRPTDSVLDCGTGTGILALAALRTGARTVVGLDVDPIACRSARANARRNGLAERVVCGSLEAIRAGASFDIVVANILVSGLDPWLPRLVGHTGRRLILAGHLEAEWLSLESRLRGLGMKELRSRRESQTGDEWGARVLGHARDLQSSTRSRSVSSSG